MVYKVIMELSLLMDKQELVKLLQWLVIIKILKLKALFLDVLTMLLQLFIHRKKECMLLEQVLSKYTMKTS